MNAIVLPRIQMPVFPELKLPDMKLLRKASEYFGYDYSPPNAFERRLFTALAAIGTMPYEPAAVVEYKKKQFKKHKENWLTNRLTMENERIKWRNCVLRAYKDPIPESVLDTALALRDQMNWVELRIDYLGNRNYQSEHDLEMARTYDPFLIVRSKATAQWHHIAVWDEPTFQG